MLELDDIQHFLLTRPRGVDVKSLSTVRTARKRASTTQTLR
jgi:hypothetical protein